MRTTCIGLILIVSAVFPKSLYSQNNEVFKPHGKAFGRIYANYHIGINEATSDEAAFELNRAYLGYEHFLSEEFSAKINLDVGSPNDLSEYSKIRRYAYFKNAYIQFKKGGLTTQFGLITLKYCELQEQLWQRRYIKKVFADEFKLGSSADLGAMVNYTFSDKISVDFSMMNGEGYTSLQADDIFKYGIGATYNPVKSLTLRSYTDYIKIQVAQVSQLFLASYTYKEKLNITAEYNYQFNNNYKEGQDLFGYSVYGWYSPKKQIQLFARFDKLSSAILPEKTNPWQLSKDGSMLIGGIQYTPVKGVKIALDYQDWYPWAANMNNNSFIYLDLEVSL